MALIEIEDFPSWKPPFIYGIFHMLVITRGYPFSTGGASPSGIRKWQHFSTWYLVGGSVAMLKNDGLRQWEGLIIPYMTWKIKAMFQTTNQNWLVMMRKVWLWNISGNIRWDHPGNMGTYWKQNGKPVNANQPSIWAWFIPLNNADFGKV